MKKKYNAISIPTGLLGLVIQVFGSVQNSDPLMVIGSLLFFIGLAYYAKAKGRSAWWGLMGFFSWIGLIVLALLSDES